MARTLPALLLAAALAGCAHDGDGYPSLKPRPGEAMGFAEPARPVAAAAPDPALDTAVGDATARLETAARSFDADLAGAQRLAAAAAGRPVGSDAWLAAQNAMTTLDARRSETAALLDALDARASARAAALVVPYPALEALRGRAGAEAERQAAAIAAIQAMLPAA